MMDDHPREIPASFLDELKAIAQDPAVRRLALRAAGTRELAQDALEDTLYAVARTRDPQSISDLRAYFCKTLIRQINRQVVDPMPIPVEDISAISDGYRVGGRSPTGLLSADFEGELHTLLQVEEWLTRLRNERNKLAASIPGRSKDPSRYRAVIITAAGMILRMVTEGVVDADDWSAILRSEYSEWFAEPDVSSLVRIRRVRIARQDTQRLLQALVQPEHAPRQVSRLEFIHPRSERLDLMGPPDERVRTADDTILSALFLKAEQTLLPHEMPYNLEEGLQMFTEWLDSQVGLVS
jgi:hypothetical protein